MLVPIVLLVALLTPITSALAKDGIIISDSNGSVSVTNSEGTPVDTSAGTPIGEGFTITTPEGSTVTLTLADGTNVVVAAGSTVSIVQAGTPSGGVTQINLVEGAVLAENASGGNVEVITPTGSTNISGAVAKISVDPASSKTTVSNHSGTVTTTEGGTNKTISSGMQTTVTRTNDGRTTSMTRTVSTGQLQQVQQVFNSVPGNEQDSTNEGTETTTPQSDIDATIVISPV